MNDATGIQWRVGDRVWLLPDIDKREVKTKLPGVIAKVLESGRIKVTYVDMRCLLAKTVEPKRLEARHIPCQDLKERMLDKAVNRA